MMNKTIKVLFVLFSLNLVHPNNSAAFSPRPKYDTEIRNQLGSTRWDSIKKLILNRTRNEQMDEISPIEKGRGTSKIYQIRMGTTQSILRILDSKRNQKIYIPIEAEIQNTTLAALEGIAPRILVADESLEFILMEKVEALALNIHRNDPDFLRQFSEILRKTHLLSPFAGAPKSVFRDIELTAEVADLKKLPSLSQQAFHILPEIEKALEAVTSVRSSHNELSINNILHTGDQTYLIDWETSGNSDPMLDLATSSNFLNFTDKQDRTLLESYYERPANENEQAHFYLMKQVSLYFYYLKITRRLSTSTGPIEILPADFEIIPEYTDFTERLLIGYFSLKDGDFFKTYGMTFLKQFLVNTQSPQYHRAIRQLTHPLKDTVL